MSYIEQDEHDLLVGYTLWLGEHSWITEPHAKLMYFVDEFMSERKEAREWGKGGSV